jgi:hypothetical protein
MTKMPTAIPLFSYRMPPNHAVNTDARRWSFARAAVAGYLGR